MGSCCTSSSSRQYDSLYSSLRSLARFIAYACSALDSAFRFISCLAVGLANVCECRVVAEIGTGVLYYYLSTPVVISVILVN